MSVHGIPEKVPVALIGRALRQGWRDFRGLAGVSMGFAACFVVIGMVLIADGFGHHVPKGYIYAAMAFSAFVEALNMLARRRQARAAGAPKPTVH